MDICKDQYLFIGVLGELLGKTTQYIRQHHLKEMIQEGTISMAFPHTPSSPKQGYTTNAERE